MKTIILLAGYPGTGKTYMCNKILSKFPYFRIVSQDQIKDCLLYTSKCHYKTQWRYYIKG